MVCSGPELEGCFDTGTSEQRGLNTVWILRMVVMFGGGFFFFTVQLLYGNGSEDGKS